MVHEARRRLARLRVELWWYVVPTSFPAVCFNLTLYTDVNPPVHAWATFRVFKLERKMYGREDLKFLERVFQKLLLNFTWWVASV